MPVFKEGKDGPGKYRSVSLTPQPGKVMKIILEGIKKHLKDNAVIHSQHSVIQGKSCLSSLILFYYKVIHLADQGKPTDISEFQ